MTESGPYGWFTPPSSSLTEAFFASGDGVVSETYIEFRRPGENKGFLVGQLVILFQED